MPPRIQEALGQLVGAAKEGLLALSVGVGLGVLEELMAEEVEEVCGPKGKHDPDRVAYRHGSDDGEVTLGGRRVPVERPRMRTKDGEQELPVRTYEHFASRDQLSRVVLERMLAGVSTRRYRRVQEPVGEQVERSARSTSKSAVSRTFIARTKEALLELMSRPLADVRLAVLMIDGVGLKDHTCVVALGITTDGVKIPLGLWEGSTENKTVTSELLSNLVHRGLDVEQGVLVVIDGSKALRAAVNDVLGKRTPVQRCQIHKERNVLDHLADRDRDLVKRRLRRAWAETDYERALEQLTDARRRAGALPPRRGRVAARGDGRDADRHPPGRHRLAQEDARLDEPVRVDDRVRAPQRAERQVLAERRDVPALDRRRDARSRAAVPTHHRLPGPRQARRPRRARSHPSPAQPRSDRGGRYRRRRVVTSHPDRHRSSTPSGTSSQTGRR